MDLADTNTDSLKKKISEQIPEFLELEEFHKKRTIEYEQSKREIVGEYECLRTYSRNWSPTRKKFKSGSLHSHADV